MKAYNHKATKAGTKRVAESINAILEPLYNEGFTAVDAVQSELLKLVKNEGILTVVSALESMIVKATKTKDAEKVAHRKVVHNLVIGVLKETLRQAKRIQKKAGLTPQKAEGETRKGTPYAQAKTKAKSFASRLPKGLTEKQLEAVLEAIKTNYNG